MISQRKTSLAILLSALAITACDANKETAAPATEPAEAKPAAVEVATSVTQQAGSTSTLIVEKSTEASDTAFIATTAEKTMTATVAAIDLAARQATLTTKDGKSLTITAKEDTANLDQVSVGDTVNTRHVQQVVIKLLEGKQIPPSSSLVDKSIQAKEGQMPLRVDSETLVNVYTVEAINLEANSFTLKNVEGQTEDFIAKDAKNLARATVGDSVIVTITDAFAAEVVKANAQ